MNVDLVVTGFALAAIAAWALGFGMGMVTVFLSLYWISRGTDSVERILDKAEVVAAASRTKADPAEPVYVGRMGKC